MWVRLAFLQLKPGKLDDFRELFHYQLMPEMSGRSGYQVAYLLEPDDGERVIVYSAWETRSDVEHIERQDAFDAIAGELRPLLAGPVYQQTYEATQ